MIEADHAPAPYRQDQAPWGWREIAIVVLITMVALVVVFTVARNLPGSWLAP